MAQTSPTSSPPVESDPLRSLPITVVSFVVPGIPPLPNSVSKGHWKAGYQNKKEWTEKIRLIALMTKQAEKLHGLYDHVEIHFHISVGSNRRIDPDNLMWACTKPALDGLQGVLIKNDTIDDVALSYSFDRTSPKRFSITLTGQ